MDIGESGLLQVSGSFLMLPLEKEDLASVVQREGIMILNLNLLELPNHASFNRHAKRRASTSSNSTASQVRWDQL